MRELINFQLEALRGPISFRRTKSGTKSVACFSIYCRSLSLNQDYTQLHYLHSGSGSSRVTGPSFGTRIIDMFLQKEAKRQQHVSFLHPRGSSARLSRAFLNHHRQYILGRLF